MKGNICGISIFILFINLIYFSTQAQSDIVKGSVRTKGKPLEFVIIQDIFTQIATQTDTDGNFSLTGIHFPATIQCSLLGYERKQVYVQNTNQPMLIELNANVNELTEIRIQSSQDFTSPAAFLIAPRQATLLPSAFGDFNKILAVIPGVVSNNELSSTYSVRGGNYDENLIYVNGFEIYKPMLIRAGQQEGLSFINPQMAEKVDFYTGAWESKYGDKLSSVMHVSYKQPEQFGGSATASLLGGQAHLEGTSENKRFSFIVGYRNKSARYLLNTLPVQGQYFPVFHDGQTFATYDLTSSHRRGTNRKTTLQFIGSLAANRYKVIPELQEATFGTVTQTLKLTVGFDGTESMRYDTWQGGIKLNHWSMGNMRHEWMVSGVDSREYEYANLEAGYRLCDVDLDPNQSSSIRCGQIRGLGTLFNYARNSLQARIFAAENRSYVLISSKIQLEYGMRASQEVFHDRLHEYRFSDSADFVRIEHVTQASQQLRTQRMTGYAQLKYNIDSTQRITLGIRVGTYNFAQGPYVSPTIHYDYSPKNKAYTWYIHTGIYRQPPFYREFRDFNGTLRTNLLPQSAWQITAGNRYTFTAWGRPFILTNALYYKYMWHIIPYDIDNVRIRYYATNDAVAYAVGNDFRLSGEFIKGTESWFSLSILQTRERLMNGSQQGWVRRPTDQRVTVAVFFQDHIPKYPAWKVYVHLLFGSGLPFGVPNSDLYRNIYTMPAYRRVDLGTNWVISSHLLGKGSSKTESLSIGIEVLNVIGVANTLSYIWIRDFQNNQYAVPNTLSQRFLNIKVNFLW